MRLLSAITSLVFAAAASAQCSTWTPTLGTSSFDGVTCITEWDSPSGPVIVVGGTFTTIGGIAANHIAIFDGSSWQAVGNGVNDTVWTLTTWDPDGPGPLPPVVVAGGEFHGEFPGDYVAFWNGDIWDSLGWGTDGVVYAAASWDPDGPGPLPPQLVIAGDFQNVGSDLAGAVQPNHVARWDGQAWRALGTGVVGVAGTDTTPASIYAITSWDPDGSGVATPKLIIGGSFATAGGVAASNIAMWDGAWHALGAGFAPSNFVFALEQWTPDVPGPQTPRLVAGGALTASGSTQLHNIAQWSGSTWSGVGAGTDEVRSLTLWDPDGSGPAGQRLVAGCTGKGAGTHGALVWNNTTWQTLGLTGSEVVVTGLASWQPDASAPSLLVAGGSFATPTQPEGGKVAAWNGSSWQTYRTDLNNTVRTFMTADIDGSGPQLIAGGDFNGAELSFSDYIGRWDAGSSTWQGLGWGTDGPVNALAMWDPDGAGPLPPQLVAAGSFAYVGADETGAIVANRIARWDANVWHTLGTGLSGNVSALLTWNSGGTSRLVAGGDFTGAGYPGHVGYFDGTAWQSFGWGLDGAVRALALWDPDGSGPLAPQVVAAGEFPHAGADSTGEVTVKHIARWDGAAWRALGPGLPGNATAAMSFDFDGTGPQQAQLVAGGAFGISRWDGSAWHMLSFSAGIITQVHALTSWDVDGSGTLPAQLVASVTYTYAEPPASPTCKFCCGCTRTQTATLRWDGADWQTLSLDAPVSAFTQLSQGATPGGVLIAAANSGIVSHGALTEPIITAQPAPVTAAAGTTASFTVAQENATSFVWYWRAAGSQSLSRLIDGPTAQGSVVSDSGTATLTIAHLTRQDAGIYTCTVGNSCGLATTRPATLTIPGCGSADFNHDGDAATDADIEAFFRCVAGSCCAACDSADFNGDGDAATDADIEAFFRVIAGGGC